MAGHENERTLGPRTSVLVSELPAALDLNKTDTYKRNKLRCSLNYCQGSLPLWLRLFPNNAGEEATPWTSHPIPPVQFQ